MLTLVSINVGNYVRGYIVVIDACFVDDFVSECGLCCDKLDQSEYCSRKAYFTAVEKQLLVHF